MPDDSAYVDTSILGAYYCPEPLSTSAETALLRLKVPVISNLTEVEFSSLIARKRRLKELSSRQAVEILNLFASHVAEGFYRRMLLEAEHFLKARELITNIGAPLHTLDALHLSAAISEGVPIMTADSQLARATRRLETRTLLIA